MNGKHAILFMSMGIFLGGSITSVYFLFIMNEIPFEERVDYLKGYYSDLEFYESEVSWTEFKGLLAKLEDDNYRINLIEVGWSRFEELLKNDIEQNNDCVMIYDSEAKRLWYCYPYDPEPGEDLTVVCTKGSGFRFWN